MAAGRHWLQVTINGRQTFAKSIATVAQETISCSIDYPPDEVAITIGGMVATMIPTFSVAADGLQRLSELRR